MKISNKMFILVSIGILAILFIRGIYNSIKFGDSEYGMAYVLGQAVGGTLAWFSMIALFASLVFLIIGFINKKRKKPIFMRAAITFGVSIISFVILFVVIFVSMNIENEHNKIAEKKKKESEYLMAAANFYNDIESFEMYSTLVLFGYSDTWSNAIKTQKDFNAELISKKTESDPMIKHADVIYTEMGQQLKLVSEATKKHPDLYKDVYEEYKTIYSVVTALNEQVSSPTGSLISFNQNVNSLQQEYKKAKGNIDISITDEIKKQSEKIKEANDIKIKSNEVTKY
ncbi:O-antigen ligase family protein [Bacillus cereus]|uniref:O-antigen ligase family protein n=1 Tax=Bacillus cereus TaxID=1396 RepID=UPI0024050A7A|nr:O-antigen ligase family protein [Bacillus cereus]MDF9538131.1 O-antigen ligase family protein [Bacillus cereus]MDF9586213.1 O-antigen ligase family protein [Bacillus cereus]MDG1591638.1 O-antigen ligase family protein [Bacillus cereus]